jgi:hypothetical protein
MSGRTIRATLAGLTAGGLALGAVALVPAPAFAAGGGAPGYAPTLFVGDARISEGDAGRHVAKIPVTLSSPLPGDAYFTFESDDDGKGGATAGEDYRPMNRVKRIRAGATSATLNVPVLGDTTEEDLEMVSFEITSFDAPPIAIAKGHGSVVIVDDDATGDAPPDGSPVVGAAATHVVEGDAGVRRLPVMLTLSSPQPTDVLVTWHTAADIATPGSDFKNVPDRVTRIKAGTTQKAVLVQVYGDPDVEVDEELRVVIDGVTGAGMGIDPDPDSGLIIISDDDADADGDGLVDLAERFYKSDPNAVDSDGDLISDGDEARLWFTDVNQADTDGDGFDDLIEIKSGTSPVDPDDHPVGP